MANDLKLQAVIEWTTKGVGAVRDAQRDMAALGGTSRNLTVGLDRAELGLRKLNERAGEASQRWQALGGAAHRAGQVMAVAGGAALATLTALSVTALRAGSDLAESMSKAEVVFGDAADSVKGFASTAAKSLGQSKAEALEMTATFGNLFLGLGLGQKEAADLAMTMVQLGTDIASFNNLPIEEALLKIRAGLVGETEPLRTVGVLLSEAAVQSKAMAMGLGNGTSALSEQTKMLVRAQIILDQTGTAQGDFARTSHQLANQQRILNAQWNDAKAALGTALTPAMTRLLNTITPIVEKVATWIDKHPTLTGLMFAGATAASALTLALGGILMAMPGLLTLINLGTQSWARYAASVSAAGAASQVAAGQMTLPGLAAAGGAGGAAAAGAAPAASQVAAGQMTLPGGAAAVGAMAYTGIRAYTAGEGAAGGARGGNPWAVPLAMLKSAFFGAPQMLATGAYTSYRLLRPPEVTVNVAGSVYSGSELEQHIQNGVRQAQRSGGMQPAY